LDPSEKGLRESSGAIILTDRIDLKETKFVEDRYAPDRAPLAIPRSRGAVPGHRHDILQQSS
jgi:hypothetical protein